MKLSIDFSIDMRKCTEVQKLKVDDFISTLKYVDYPYFICYELDMTPEGEMICDENRNWKYQFIRIECIENTEEYDKVIHWLMKEKIPYMKRPWRTYYEEGEMLLEDYFRFEYSPLLRLKDWHEYGTIFHYNECENCQHGIEQDGLITFPIKKIIKYDLIVIRPVMLVKKAVKEELEAIQATGIQFLPVIDYASKKVSEKYFQLKVLHYLPPKRNMTRMCKPYCPDCHSLSARLDYMEQYSKSDFNERYDFYLGYERDLRTLATKSIFPWRALVISKRILDIFQKHYDAADKENFFYYPVHLWEDDKFNEEGYLK